ncbi:SDR family oxidoreductase [Prochlorococcus sp. MIT 1300]|uniref:SDR family oxidoreductase n=1 Tax=Prochlorococcus sp. MIT 1300 TaxID=3096218 RepID=UPI002A75B336|nr:SDR family oxidoreductase [Prochlorococcus sp. MIT 1300]
MKHSYFDKNKLEGCRIGITGATGELGSALSKKLQEKGAFVIGLTHGSALQLKAQHQGPQEWIQWECGEEQLLQETLKKLDILILNHGVNPKGKQSPADINSALEINALSSWRLIELFEQANLTQNHQDRSREIWVNTSEAEIQPALSPAYELSKRLLGNLVSIYWNNLSNQKRKSIRVRKLILGPFRSKLNPIGVMPSNWVADQIIFQAGLGLNLIIVTPNPLTYIIMPLVELIRSIYTRSLSSLELKEKNSEF